MEKVSADTLRLAVGQASGRRSSIWRIWFGPADIYAAFRTMAGIRKITVHYPRPESSGTVRYIGYTKDYAEKLTGKSNIKRHERTDVEWPGLEIAPGYFIEFRFRIPESELRVFDSDLPADVIWLDVPAERMGTEITILSGPPTHEGPIPQRADGNQTQCLLDHTLKNGRRVWVIHHEIPAPSPENMTKYRQQVYANAKRQGQLPLARSIHKSSRVSLTMNCGDGSFAEAELAADFLWDRSFIEQ